MCRSCVYHVWHEGTFLVMITKEPSSPVKNLSRRRPSNGMTHQILCLVLVPSISECLLAPVDVAEKVCRAYNCLSRAGPVPRTLTYKKTIKCRHANIRCRPKADFVVGASLLTRIVCHTQLNKAPSEQSNVFVPRWMCPWQLRVVQTACLPRFPLLCELPNKLYRLPNPSLSR